MSTTAAPVRASTRALAKPAVEATFIARTKQVNPAASAANCTGAKGTRSGSCASRMVSAPSSRAASRKGSRMRKMDRQPRAPMR